MLTGKKKVYEALLKLNCETGDTYLKILRDFGFVVQKIPAELNPLHTATMYCIANKSLQGDIKHIIYIYNFID